MENTFKAPWGTFLKVMTAIALIILLGCSTAGILGISGILNINLAEYSLLWIIAMIGIPALTVILTLFFIIRKYEIQDNKLLIYRLGWKKVIDLSNLETAEFDPKAVKGSIRLFGNGGLFAFSGIYRNKKLGNYRIFATDFKKSVVLKTKEKIYIVTPENPENFVEKVKQLR